MKVQEIIDAIIRKTGMEPIPEGQTCDKFIIGDRNAEVTGIATTFMATVDVIRKAAAQGINFIITHEPTWFTGMDETGWLENDPVYLAKKKLLEENHISVWRFHDHMHMCQEDGIYRGFDLEFGWGKYRLQMPESEEFIDHFGAIYDLPEMTLRELCDFFKEKSNMKVIRIVGNPEMKVRRVSSLVGGGSLGLGEENLPMRHMEKYHVDVAICGDITEWTLSAYVRDAVQLGMNKGMLVIGHERSEEPGMKHLVEWLKPLVGDTRVCFISAEEPFLYL